MLTDGLRDCIGLTLLSEISELTRKIEEPNELTYAIAKAVGEHFQVNRCLFNETDVENDREIVHRDYYNGVESVAGIHKLSDYSSITSSEMQAGKTVVNTDSKIDPRTAQDYERTYAPNKERAYVAVPIIRDGRWVGTLWTSDDIPRQWSKEEVALLETVAERTWLTMEKLRGEEKLRASEGTELPADATAASLARQIVDTALLAAEHGIDLELAVRDEVSRRLTDR